jgi:5-oxopent-3-ene-1,2,5-tricarboxylate decarboxylase/2-hydroxyhepta-2,4-diene-1,7-dioate isomerase
MLAPLLVRDSTVYGVALNFRASLENLAPLMHSPPYQAPPVAPVLYIKPRNTWIGPGAAIPLPAGVEHLRVAGTLGMVIGNTAFRVSAEDALDHVAAYAAVNDVSIPHESYFRPAIRERCRDGFCAIGPGGPLINPGPTSIRIFLNGQLRCTASTDDLVRPVARLIADISEFITLRPGDLLLAGEPHDAPLARAGDRVRVEVGGLPVLENQVLPE